MHPSTGEEALAADDGSVPGDGLGAAGLDSSIFAHLKRNWSWHGGGEGSREQDDQEVTIRTQQGRERVTVSRQPNVKRSTRGQKRNRAKSPRVERREEQEKVEDEEGGSQQEQEASSRSRGVVRRVVRRKVMAVERKPYYDEKDKAALRLMRKLRVDWSSGEDAFLLLCKVLLNS